MADSIEAFLNRLHHPALAGIDLSLDRMHRLLSLLGNPHKRMPPVIHVAGTNGKGSLLAFLKSILEAGGYRVHRYTSPHLVHFSERIMLAGKDIENQALEPILRHVASALDSQPATFFEATTAAAFLAFAEKPADVLLLETGMGGRLDATNVIEKPVLTAITPISFDHTEYLGNTLPAIAAEKAGILKGGISCVVGRQEADALHIIESTAEKLGAPLYRLGAEWQINQGIYLSAKRTLAIGPSLSGAFQYDNAATAIACIDFLPQFHVSDAQISQAIASTQWPARLQKLSGKLARVMPLGVELWLDGGHNPQGGQVLGEWLSGQAGKHIALICGMMKGKDPHAFLAPLAPYANDVYAVAIPGESQSQEAVKVADAAQGLGLQAQAVESVQKALQMAAGHAKNPAIICICGSLYLAGKVLAADQGSV